MVRANVTDLVFVLVMLTNSLQNTFVTFNQTADESHSQGSFRSSLTYSSFVHFSRFFTAFNLNVTLKNDTQIHCSSLNRWTNENSGRQTNRLDCLSTLLSFSFLCRMHHAIRYSCDTQVIAFSTLKLLKCHVDGSGTQSLGMMIHVWAALMRSLLNAKMVHFNVKSLMLLSVAQMKTN